MITLSLGATFAICRVKYFIVGGNFAVRHLNKFNNNIYVRGSYYFADTFFQQILVKTVFSLQYSVKLSSNIDLLEVWEINTKTSLYKFNKKKKGIRNISSKHRGEKRKKKERKETQQQVPIWKSGRKMFEHKRESFRR